MRILWRTIIRLLSLVLAAVALYAMAAVVLSLMPVNRQWQPPAEGITVWLVTNGVHASLIFPLQAADVDWSADLPADRVLALTRGKTLPATFDHIVFGWGDRRFFLDTPRWADLKLSTALHAISGMDGTLMHIEYVPPPQAAADSLPITLSVEQYRRLARYVQDSFARSAEGRLQQVAGHAYADYDAFFEAQGHYSPFMTCNDWVRRALVGVGVRTSVWSPFDKPLFWQIEARS